MKMKTENILGATTERIFKLAHTAVPFVYQNSNGDYLTENVGAYKPLISVEMVKDMRTVSILLLGLYPELSAKIRDAADVMEKNNLTICKMLNDVKQENELSLYEHGNSESAINNLIDIHDDRAFDETPFNYFKPMLKEWSKRLLVMDVRAYYIEREETLECAIKAASMREFDKNGKLIFGISEDDEKEVKIIGQIERLFLRALIRLPWHSEELSECMKIIDRIEWFVDALVSGDEKKIAYITKCAEAAKEFEDNTK